MIISIRVQTKMREAFCDAYQESEKEFFGSRVLPYVQSRTRGPNDNIHKEVDYSGTTAISIVVGAHGSDDVSAWSRSGLSLNIGWVGDSKAVLSRAGVAVELTRDHTPSRPDERRRIEAAGGFVRSNR